MTGARGLRKVLQQPLTHDPAAFAERFGVELYTQFDMTEVGPAIVSESVAGAARPEKGYCGRAHPGFELRLVDENDCEVPAGEAGMLALRCGVPWVIAPGYFRMPEATAAAWRNGWFHTGDVMRCDAHGNYYYTDRAKDVIRRRGREHLLVRGGGGGAVPPGGERGPPPTRWTSRSARAR